MTDVALAEKRTAVTRQDGLVAIPSDDREVREVRMRSLRFENLLRNH